MNRGTTLSTVPSTKLMRNVAGATKVMNPAFWPSGTPSRMRNGPGWRLLRSSVSAASETVMIPNTISTMWPQNGVCLGLAPYWAASPPRPGPRPNPTRKNTPARAAASALLSPRAWSTTKAAPTPRKPPIARPCRTRPANSSGTLSARANVSEAIVMIAIAGNIIHLRPSRSARLPAMSMVGTTVTV